MEIKRFHWVWLGLSVEAVEFTGEAQNASEVLDWLRINAAFGSYHNKPTEFPVRGYSKEIVPTHLSFDDTFGRSYIAKPNVWIITNKMGDFWLKRSEDMNFDERGRLR